MEQIFRLINSSTSRFQPSCLSIFCISICGEDSGTCNGVSYCKCKFPKPSFTVLSLFYLFVLIFQFIFSGYIISYLQVLTIPLLQSYSCIAMLSGFTLSLVLNCASIMKTVLSVSEYTQNFIFSSFYTVAEFLY